MAIISIYPSEEFKDKIKELAEKEKRSLNFLILKILKDYVEKNE